jgi:hypothetical protein
MFRCLLGTTVVALLACSTPALALDCTPTADAVDPRCYGAYADGVHDDGAALQLAINAAVAEEKPLHLVHAHFVTLRPLTIDYGQGPLQGREGFLLQSDDATIDGTRAGQANVLTLWCAGGTPTSPKGCFYFHQTGTLFVNGQTPYWVLVVGEGNFSDAQNSIIFDHVVVNNSGSGGGTILDYVLSSHLNIVSDTAGNSPGLAMMQVQMSTIQLAASSVGNAALQIWTYYNFGDVIETPDLEASPVCVDAMGGHSHDVTITGGTIDCAVAFIDPGHVLLPSGYNIGGAVKAGSQS